MSKGSWRRPMNVPLKVRNDNFDRALGKGKYKKENTDVKEGESKPEKTTPKK